MIYIKYHDSILGWNPNLDKINEELKKHQNGYLNNVNIYTK